MLTRSSSADIIVFQPKPQAKRFLRLDYELLQSQRWRLLRPVGRALYLEMAAKFNGFNNGSIGFSNREACQKLHIRPRTASRAFRALEMLDLIVCTKRGTLKTRQASEWRLPAFD
jgi:hypothetical protein